MPLSLIVGLASYLLRLEPDRLTMSVTRFIVRVTVTDTDVTLEVISTIITITTIDTTTIYTATISVIAP